MRPWAITLANASLMEDGDETFDEMFRFDGADSRLGKLAKTSPGWPYDCWYV